jgi:3-phenylpropionate/cinnamic acid dioxygenase small subunit
MDIQDKAFKEWFAQYDNNIEYASEKIAWDAWKEAKAQAVPEGFVLVPKEPTLLMQRAGSAEAIKPNLGIASMRDIYKAMIEAQEQK